MNYGMGDGVNYGMGDLGFKIKMPKIKIKNPIKAIGKAVGQVAKIATLPVRAVASTAISVVSPKAAAGLTPEISKQDFANIGKVGKVAAVVTAGVIAAPAVGGLLAKAGISKAGLTELAKKVLAKKANQESIPSYEELPPTEQTLVSQEEYSRLVAEANAMNTQELTAAVPMNLRDAVADKANDPMVIIKQYAPYIIGGGFFLLFVLPRLMGGGQPIIIRSNPRRRRRR